MDIMGIVRHPAGVRPAHRARSFRLPVLPRNAAATIDRVLV